MLRLLVMLLSRHTWHDTLYQAQSSPTLSIYLLIWTFWNILWYVMQYYFDFILRFMTQIQYFTSTLSTIVLLILSNFITPSFHSGVGHLPGLSSLSWADLGEKIWKKFSFIKSNLMWNVGTVFYFFQHWNKLCYCPLIK